LESTKYFTASLYGADATCSSGNLVTLTTIKLDVCNLVSLNSVNPSLTGNPSNWDPILSFILSTEENEDGTIDLRKILFTNTDCTDDAGTWVDYYGNGPNSVVMDTCDEWFWGKDFEGASQSFTTAYAKYTIGGQTSPNSLPVGLYLLSYPLDVVPATQVDDDGKAVVETCPDFMSAAPNSGYFLAEGECGYLGYLPLQYAKISSCSGANSKVSISFYSDDTCATPVDSPSFPATDMIPSVYDLTDLVLDKVVCHAGNSGQLFPILANDDAGSNRRLKVAVVPFAINANICTKSTTLSLKDLLALLCFAGSESVLLESGASKLLSEVVVGDRVLAASAAGKTLFSPVVAIPHALNDVVAVFQHISTDSGRDIKLTPLHLIANGVCGSGKFSLVQAGSVAAGSCLQSVDGEDRVVSNEAVQGAGAYSVVTQEALVVVNGFVASPFAENHAVGNAYYNIHRALSLLAPGLLQSSWGKAANLAFGQVASAL